jgi:hypothetical protein
MSPAPEQQSPLAPVEQSNRVPFLIEEIKKFEVVGRNHGRAALMTRMDEGDRLRKLKDSIEHGRWLPILEELRIHEMRARRYMRLAEPEHRALIEEKLKSDFESDFGLTDALNAIQDFEEKKKIEAHRARYASVEDHDRQRLAAEQERRDKRFARIKRKEDKRLESEPWLFGTETAPAPASPRRIPIIDALNGFAHYVRHYLERLAPDQRSAFIETARAFLDSMEAQHRAHTAAQRQHRTNQGLAES